MVAELGAYTSLTISGPNGSKENFLFFCEPETPEEIQAQAPYKATQQLFELGYRSGWRTRQYESPLRYLIVPAIVLGIVLGGFLSIHAGAFAGFLLGGAVCVPLCTLVVRYTNRIETPINEDRAWFAPVREKLYALAKDNDFRGALGYALDVTGCAK